MPFRVTIRLQTGNRFVWGVGKETLQTTDFKRRLRSADMGIIGQQVFDKTLFHFHIRETKPIYTKFRIIPLDRQVAALVNHRDRIRIDRIHAVKRIRLGLFMRQTVQIILITFQEFNQIGGRSG